MNWPFAWPGVEGPFLIPLLAGLPLAIVLPLLGNLQRLREEWLATLGLTHLAAASALAGMGLGLSAVWSAPLGAMLGTGLKHLFSQQGNSVYAAMILGGWAMTLLIAANTPLGHALAHAMLDGQLYFATLREMVLALVLCAIGLAALPWLTPRLTRARLFPTHDRANALPAWRWHLGFDLLIALGVAVSTPTLGLMATFALVFLPPWIAFARAPHWRAANIVAAAVGFVAYLLAYLLALWLDQPFGPTLVLLLVLVLLTGLSRPARHAPW